MELMLYFYPICSDETKRYPDWLKAMERLSIFHHIDFGAKFNMKNIAFRSKVQHDLNILVKKDTKIYINHNEEL